MRAAETKEVQRGRILRHLADEGALATTEARTLYGIMHPAGRVAELRSLGHRIITAWRHIEDAEGVLHRQGVYLLEGAHHEN